MNQQQRNYLIAKIKETASKRISELQNQKQEYPSLANYLFHAVLKDELKLKSQEQIIQAIKDKALAAKEGENWLSEERMGMNKERSIRLAVNDIIIVPDNYIAKVKEVQDHNKGLSEQIAALKLQSESLETRIQLASDKTLQKMINEVDDMGNLSLIDANIKGLTNGEAAK